MQNKINEELDKVSVSESYLCDVEDTKKYLQDKTSGLTILTQNVRSISKNFDELQVLLHRLKLKCDILILTECWLRCNPILPQIDGYNTFSTKINPIQNDGVVIYAQKCMNVAVEEQTFLEGNCLALKL